MPEPQIIDDLKLFSNAQISGTALSRFACICLSISANWQKRTLKILTGVGYLQATTDEET